jgi:uncharacterized protein (UPF0264 family)
MPRDFVGVYDHSSSVAVEFNRATLQQLRPEAAARGTSVPQLIRDVIEVVATDKLVGAVLDDGTK